MPSVKGSFQYTVQVLKDFWLLWMAPLTVSDLLLVLVLRVAFWLTEVLTDWDSEVEGPMEDHA